MYQRALGSGVPCSRAAEIIPTVAGHGFQYVRFTSFHDLTDVQLQAVRTQCEEAGLTPFSAHAPGQFLPEDPDQIETRLAFHRRVLDQVAQLGADRITFHLASVENVRDAETEAYVARIAA